MIVQKFEGWVSINLAELSEQNISDEGSTWAKFCRGEEGWGKHSIPEDEKED